MDRENDPDFHLLTPGHHTRRFVKGPQR